MQYMLLIYEPEDAYAGEAGEATMMEIVEKHMALAEALQAEGQFVSGSGLQGSETATTVIAGPDGCYILHDGPFAETREQLGGYYVIDVADLDAALAIARRIPGVPGAKVEVRPLIVH